MNDISTLHDDAMNYADEGDRARRRADHTAARAAYGRALELERQAAEQERTQPSRCILFRSAAWLALEAEDPAEAERLAACGLADHGVPERVKGELRAVAEESRLRLHQPLPPPAASSSVTLHLDGPAVGYGGASPSDVDPRVGAVRHLLVRTAERSNGQPFRKKGTPNAAVQRQLNPRVQYAQGSVVAQVTLGGTHAEIWDANSQIVANLRKGLEAYNAGGEAALIDLIPDEEYRENFAALATQLAPDSKRVTSVDVLTATAAGPLPVVRLRERRPARAAPETAERAETQVLIGELRAADKTGAKSTIKIDDGNRSTTVVVRNAVMEDIVRPFYGKRVQITVQQKGKSLELVGMPEPADG